jgi:hypothetical protein
MSSIRRKSQRRDDRCVTASSGERAGRAERGGRDQASLKSAAHLDTAPDAMDLIFESLDFAQQLGDRPNEALIDIDLRMLMLRVLKESLGGR